MSKQLDGFTCYKVITKLIGPIEPCGNTNIDSDRENSLDVMIDVLDKLLYDISMVSKNKDRHAASERRIGLKAHRFLCDVKDQLDKEIIPFAS